MKKLKLCEDVKDVLDQAMPKWMKKLCAVNFDIDLLDILDQDRINNYYGKCFIGELHNGGGYAGYDHGERCNECEHYAHLVPYVFRNKKTTLIPKKDMMEDFQLLEIKPMDQTYQDKKKLLKMIAEHVKEEHPDLMSKPKVENDC